MDRITLHLHLDTVKLPSGFYLHHSIEHLYGGEATTTDLVVVIDDDEDDISRHCHGLLADVGANEDGACFRPRRKEPLVESPL